LAYNKRVSKNINKILPNEKIYSLFPYIYNFSKIDFETKTFDNSPQNEDITDSNNYINEDKIDNSENIIDNKFIESQEKNDKTENDEREEDNEEEIISISIPLRENNNEYDTLYIIDEAHLITDDYRETLDVKFGSGKLLKDFLEFSQITNTSKKNKIIFIGDIFQILNKNPELSSLNRDYLEKTYNLNVVSYQLNDKPNYSTILKEALKVIEKIRENYFSYLKFEQNSQFIFLHDNNLIDELNDFVINNKGHFLTYTNKEAIDVNLFIKEKILKNGRFLTKNDIVVFDNSIKVLPKSYDIFPLYINSGSIAKVIEVSTEIITEKAKINIKGKKKGEGREIFLHFRKITLQILDENEDKIAEILSLENYRNNSEGILTNQEKIAYNVLLNNLISKYLKEYPFEESSYYLEMKNSIEFIEIEDEMQICKKELSEGKKVKTLLKELEKKRKNLIKKYKKLHKLKSIETLSNDYNSKYFQYKNAAFLRYGWASTVHKAISNKWDEVILNVEPNFNLEKKNIHYFKWLYSGIIRANEKIYLLKYKPITPYDKTEIKENLSDNLKEYFYIAVSKDKNHRIKEYEEFLKNTFLKANLVVERINSSNNWQILLRLKKENQSFVFQFYYNAEGKLNYPIVKEGDKNAANEIIQKALFLENNFSFEKINDKWRRFHYENLAKNLNEYNIKICNIIQNEYLDKIKFVDDNKNILRLSFFIIPLALLQRYLQKISLIPISGKNLKKL